MCVCTPGVRTPYCGKMGCTPPKQEDPRACKKLVMAVGFKNGKMEMARNRHETGRCNGNVGKCGCIHAEILLLRAMPHPDIVVMSHSPCIFCAKALVDAGVKEVAYEESHHLKDGLLYLLDHGVSVRRIQQEQ